MYQNVKNRSPKKLPFPSQPMQVPAWFNIFADTKTDISG